MKAPQQVSLPHFPVSRSPRPGTVGGWLARFLRNREHDRPAGIDLCRNKSMEFSPDIQKLFLLAAKVAYLTYGAGAREIEPFERDVYYYANFTPPDPIVAAYDAFKRTTS